MYHKSNESDLNTEFNQKILSRQFLGYSLVAALGLGVDFGVLYLATEFLELSYLISAFLGFLAGLTLNFYLSEKFVFGGSVVSSRYKRFVIFGFIGAVGLVFLEIGMWLQVEHFGVGYLQAKITASVFVYLWNFYARKRLYR